MWRLFVVEQWFLELGRDARAPQLARERPSRVSSPAHASMPSKGSFAPEPDGRKPEIVCRTQTLPVLRSRVRHTMRIMGS